MGEKREEEISWLSFRDMCPSCMGRGKVITAYICFGPNPRHETMGCLECDQTGSLKIYILNKLEETCKCKKHRINYGNHAEKLIQDYRLRKWQRNSHHYVS